VEGIAQLPDNWIQDESTTRHIGGQWRQQGSSCLLAVPSAILPEESNFVFNPQHPDAARLRLVRKRRFHFDLRLI
jgi:RES domain-containing protein